MNEAVNEEYDQFKKSFFQLTGIDLSLYKEEQMKRRLRAFGIRRGIMSFADYAEILKQNRKLLDEVLNRMTINVTEFFRNRPRWAVLEKKIRARSSIKRSLNIWSAACSTGEEAYSLAILCMNCLPEMNFSIIATDIDQKALESARQGKYLEKAIESLAPDERKHFVKKGYLFEANQQLKNKIRFMQHDLLRDPVPGKFDIIVCRNVLIYFTDEGKKVIYHKFGEALEAQGILFVGSTEQIFNPSSYRLHAAETFFYERI
ncbi:protein-glutamate O-methyltransferase CheR [Sporolactobacillus sp. CPB3-1]|uniref:protein-glutamate O-methyltransferase n=1 Tax=Sporolactobacillus mangiferae TaxID=2940498 RepID=A0ABT0MAC7_9BACL|nr:protein-glutamate O-methyltransferase CheR [Sporolactobacillus mangiferae]MCL1631829.1 protein-glutamate O-methyltransferase CheR [Sporolactobacillus mangiferae]